MSMCHEIVSIKEMFHISRVHLCVQLFKGRSIPSMTKACCEMVRAFDSQHCPSEKPPAKKARISKKISQVDSIMQAFTAPETSLILLNILIKTQFHNVKQSYQTGLVERWKAYRKKSFPGIE